MRQIYLKTRIIIIGLILTNIFFFLQLKLSLSYENKILLKVNDEIITTVDISNEMEYLRIINKKVNKLDKATLIEISKNNLIREKIKKITLKKNLQKIEIDDKYLNFLFKNTYSKLGFKNIDEFKNYLESKNLDFTILVEKFTINENWKQLIYRKYFDQVKIDEEKIKNEISNQKIIYYDLSEILFNLDKNENLDEKYKIINNSIKTKGFGNSALIFSNSDTSNKGGKIGWVNSNAINLNILKNLNSIKVNDHTKPITIPGGFLILKLNNLKIEKKEIDLKKEMKLVINRKTNDQLNQFSNLYLNKLKKDMLINEL